MTDDLAVFRASLGRFIEEECLPHVAEWRDRKQPDPAFWQRAGAFGMLLCDVPEQYGGLGGSYAHFATVLEELGHRGVNLGVLVHAVVAHYILAFGSEQQKQRWLPRLATGDLIAGIAMTEPGAGSDLQGISSTARRHAGGYLINGSKSFVTNGRLANLLCLAVKTDPQARGGRGLSMILLETAGAAGYHAGQPLPKLGMHELDTCELFFADTFVPADNLLGGEEGAGMGQMMAQLPYERLGIAVQALSSAEYALDLAVAHAKERKAFGRPLMEFQNTRFKLAECKAAVEVGRAYTHQCITRFIEGSLTAAEAATAKYWLTEQQGRVIDECLQVFGGYGYTTEYPIARLWADARMQRLGGGTSEIMKELVGWSL